jgi:hypothetical protein
LLFVIRETEKRWQLKIFVLNAQKVGGLEPPQPLWLRRLCGLALGAELTWTKIGQHFLFIFNRKFLTFAKVL